MAGRGAWKDLVRLYREGTVSSVARKQHLELLVELIAVEELAFGPVFPSSSGPPEEQSRNRDILMSAFSSAIRRDPGNLVLLRNYAFFAASGDPDESLRVIDRVVALDPGNPTNYRISAALRRQFLRGPLPDATRARETQALFSALKNFVLLADETTIAADGALGNLALAAYSAGSRGEAKCAADQATLAYRRTAAESPEQARRAPEAFHHAQTVLGLLALDAGDADKAQAHLLDSVELGPGAQLHFVVMDLGRRLLEQGYCDSVMRFSVRLRAVAGCGLWRDDADEFYREVQDRCGAQRRGA
jgi:hypothetical protein